MFIDCQSLCAGTGVVLNDCINIAPVWSIVFIVFCFFYKVKVLLRRNLLVRVFNVQTDVLLCKLCNLMFDFVLFFLEESRA